MGKEGFDQTESSIRKDIAYIKSNKKRTKIKNCNLLTI